MTNSIQYIPHHRIDKARWDECVNSADNGVIYARSFFLDQISPGWDAVIHSDYKAVMPLTWKRKYGFYYLFQPYFTPVLGLFGKEISSVLFTGFLQAIPKKFRYCEMDVNERNIFSIQEVKPGWRLTERVNYLLQLNDTPEEIENNFSRLARRMLNKARNQNLELITNADPVEVLTFYKKNYKEKHYIPPAAFENLQRAILVAKQQGHAEAYLAKLPDNTAIGAYLIFTDKKYIYSVLGGSNATGKQKGAFYMLTAAAIRKHAGSDRIFRFEGSDIPGIALFNSMFGGRPVPYYHLKYNRLPFPFNIIKS